MPLTYELITTPKHWKEAVAQLATADAIAMDTEANSFYRYPEFLCLIQFAIPGHTYILDPLAIQDLSALKDLAANPKIQKILHSADYDLRCLDRDYRIHLTNLYDTSLAIQLLRPEPLSLATALKHYLNVEITKSKKLQRADWSQRPLTPELLQYAAGDVAYLHQLRDRLSEELKAQGRLAWAEEEFAILTLTRHVPPPSPEEAALTVKGTAALSPEELARFQILYVYREHEARRVNRPPFKVMDIHRLIDWAKHPHRLPGALKTLIPKSLTPVIHPSRRQRPKRNPWTFKASERLKQLKTLRAEAAQSLNIAPFMLWPIESLEAMALDPSKAEAEIRGESAFHVRRWQREVFGETLEKFLNST